MSDTVFAAMVALVGISVGSAYFLHLRARARSQLPAGLARVRELEPLLAPGETLVWEGRPIHFVRPPRSVAITYAVLVAMFPGFLVSLTATMLSRTAPSSRTWKLTLTELELSGKIYVVGQTPSGGTVTAVASTSSIILPSPFIVVGFLAILIGGLELWRLASCRARRYGITEERVLMLDPWEKTFVQIVRAEDAEVTLAGTIVVSGGGREIRFQGIADPEAARSALGC